LTLLVGANASGKSSLIQALLLLRQSHLRGALERGELLLNGRLANIGTAQDLFRQGADDDDLEIHIQAEDRLDVVYRFEYPKGSPGQYSVPGSNSGYATNLNLFAPVFNYLNAERVGPRLLYPMSHDEAMPHDVGIHGDYAAHVIARFADTAIASEKLAYRDETTGEVSQHLGNQTQYWMRQFIPDFSMSIAQVPEADQIRVLFGNRAGMSLVRPTNIGFGFIYTLPIVVAALVATPGSLLIVENPEAHLHPGSQSAMGRFLAQVAAAGVQVVVETHSDHVLNGIRVAAKRRLIQADTVAINFLTTEPDDRSVVVRVPRLYDDGGIDPWPSGFFDQFDADLLELF
jgi:predicted ATPase